jgi:hypothetical protein
LWDHYDSEPLANLQPPAGATSYSNHHKNHYPEHQSEDLYIWHPTAAELYAFSRPREPSINWGMTPYRLSKRHGLDFRAVPSYLRLPSIILLSSLYHPFVFPLSYFSFPYSLQTQWHREQISTDGLFTKRLACC